MIRVDVELGVGSTEPTAGVAVVDVVVVAAVMIPGGDLVANGKFCSPSTARLTLL